MRKPINFNTASGDSPLRNYNFYSVYTDGIYSEYEGGVDNEIRARLAERAILDGCGFNVDADWSMPGCQAFDYFGPPKGDKMKKGFKK